MTTETVVCAKCHLACPLGEATKITVTLAPRVVIHYHPECYDPWADLTKSGAQGLPKADTDHDPVSAPAHYRWLPNGIEVIDITETLGFCMGNAVKYILRADHKGKPIEDLEKSVWYLQRELSRRRLTMATTEEKR